ncbi:MAG: hypothetical protein AAGK97_02985, partial [Bacteroidota bacterium]
MKYLLICILCFIIPSQTISQISNNACTNPLLVTNLDSCYTIINNQTLTLDGASPQGRFGFCTALRGYANNAWFTFTDPSCFLELSVNALNGNVNDLELSLFTNCQSNADACGIGSVIVPFYTNVDYFVSVTSASNTATPFELCFNSPPTPDNYSFQEAQLISSPIGSCTIVNGTNLGSCTSRGTSECTFAN